MWQLACHTGQSVPKWDWHYLRLELEVRVKSLYRIHIFRKKSSRRNIGTHVWFTEVSQYICGSRRCAYFSQNTGHDRKAPCRVTTAMNFGRRRVVTLPKNILLRCACDNLKHDRVLQLFIAHNAKSLSQKFTLFHYVEENGIIASMLGLSKCMTRSKRCAAAV